MATANQSLLVIPEGDRPVLPEILISPTAQRTVFAATVGSKYRRRYTIENTGDEAVFNHAYPLDIGRTDGMVTAGLMLSSGNDIRVVIDGLEVARTLNSHNSSASTLVWFVIPFLDVDGTITVELWFGNPSAGTPPTLTNVVDLPAHDVAATGGSRATKVFRPYLVDRTAGNAGKGGWGLDSGTQEPVPDFGVPHAWQLASTRTSSDDRRQATWQSYVATGTKYQARFDATRARLEALVFDRDTGADGVSLRCGTGIVSVRCDMRYLNLAVGDTDVTPIGQLVVLARKAPGDEWSVVFSQATLQTTETTIATATYTMPAGTKEVAFAVWPQDGLVIDPAARPDRYVYGAWFNVLEVTLSDVITQTLVAEDAWTPAYLGSKLHFWLKADQLEDDGVTDGQTVALWDDQSGNNRDAAQATSGERPTLQTNEINGLAIVRFDGVDDDMAITGLTLTKPCTVALIAKQTGGTSGRLFQGINIAANRSTNDFNMTGVSFFTYADELYTSAAHVHCCTYNGASSRGSYDGTAVTGDDGGGTPGATIQLASTGSGNFSALDLGEIIGINGSLTAAETAALEGYLAHRWGLSANLPASHPHKTLAPTVDEIYEAAWELRIGGGGQDTAVAPYKSVYVGNAKQASGAGTPRVASKIGEQVKINADTKLSSVWDSAVTAKLSDIPIPAVSGVDGVRLTDSTQTEQPGSDWLEIVPVANPLSNPDFAAGITGWTVDGVSGLLTDTRSWDNAIANPLDGGLTGSLKHVISGSSLGSGGQVLREIATASSGQQLMPVGGRQSIWLSADFRTSNANLRQRLFIQFYDAASVFISQTLGSDYTPAADTFQRRVMAAVVPEEAAYFLIGFYGIAAAASQNGTMYADRFRVNDADLVLKDVNIGALSVSYRFFDRYSGG